MSQTYKITLKPIGAFYFGGEESFSSAPLDAVENMTQESTKKYFQKRQGYFAKSEMFPQQTQLLGMLRKELLRINKKLYYFKNFVSVPKKFKDKATQIVGNSRWTTDDALALGSLEELSPLYVGKEDKLYISAPFDRGLRLEETGTGYINGRPSKAYAFKKCDDKYFGAKDYLCSDLIAKDKSKLKIDDIFTAFTQTQTQTLSYKDNNDEQLFKVKKYRLDEACHFICYLTLENDAYLDMLKTTIELGGERSRFMMQVIKEGKPDIQSDFAYLKTDQSRVVLTSDALVEAKIFKECKVTLSQKKVLRTFQRRPFNKSRKTILLARGTVFYPHEGKEQEVKGLIEKATNFRTIGYNGYLDLTQGENNVH
ncbi:MAG: hypothetical protein HF962_06800 [Sulfurovum sp.]|nr:hypothetical protein [Sulfurovum sp.]